MKNVAIITSCLSKGGAERAAGLLSIALSKHYHVYIFLVGDAPITYGYSGEIVNLHMTQHYGNLKRKFGFLGKIVCKWAYVQAVKDIKKYKAQYHIDYAISFLETPNLMNILSRGTEKVFVSVRSTRSLQNDTMISRIENAGIKRYYNTTDKVVAISYGVADDLIHQFSINKEKIKTIYNFYDFNRIKQLSLQSVPDYMQHLYEGKRVIVTMGRLIPAKKHLQLIDICHELFQSVDNTLLIIIGSGELKEDIKSKIEQLEETQRMFLIDYQENPFPMIRKADVFVMNSEREGFCNSIMEAMACETAVISTDCLCGPREIIANQREYNSKISSYQCFEKGILTPVNYSEEMRKALYFMLSDDTYRASCVESASHYIDSFSNKTIETEWINLIEGE